MNCQEWEERVAHYAGGDLTGPETTAVEQHLMGCPECRKLAAELREQLGLLRDLHAEPIADAHLTALRMRVLSELSAARPAWWRHGWISIAAAAAIVMLAVFVAPRRRVETPKPAQIAVQRVPEALPAAPSENAPARPAVRHARPRRLVASRAPIGTAQTADPVVIKLMTNDPDVVIYWIGNK